MNVWDYNFSRYCSQVLEKYKKKQHDALQIPLIKHKQFNFFSNWICLIDL